MVNHPNRSAAFNITIDRPWLIEIDTGVLTWPKLTFPFEMTGAGTNDGQRCTRNALRAAVAACQSYFRHNDTASFVASARLLGPSGTFVENLTI
jgi:hypothetical protein